MQNNLQPLHYADLQGKPDLIMVMEREGIELRRKGRFYWSHCPFHEDKTPSLKADPEKQTFFCFGCQAGGDVIAFIQKLHDLSFKDALKSLGMKPGAVPAVNSDETIKRRLVKGFRNWEWSYRGELADRFRECHRMTRNLKTMEEAERLAPIFHELPLIEYRIKILAEGTDEEKHRLFREVESIGK